MAIINGGTRSGKEWLAHDLEKKHRARLVGTTTRGAFLGGKPFEIDRDRFLLFLAVIAGPEDLDLEGKGVSPDIVVPNELPYRAGRDPQLERALDEAWRAAR